MHVLCGVMVDLKHVNKRASFSMIRWKKQILAKASGFLKDKRVATSNKPFSQPLVPLDLNSPAGKISTPARVAIAAPMTTNLPTPKVSTNWTMTHKTRYRCFSITQTILMIFEVNFARLLH
jgi:hypothetical protein